MIKKIKELIEDAEGWRITLERRGALPEYIDDHECEISYQSDMIICKKGDKKYGIIISDVSEGDCDFYRDPDGTTELIINHILFNWSTGSVSNSKIRPSMGNMILNTYVY